MDLTRADWRKSTFSSNNGNCVEVAANIPGIVAVRDSKNPDGAVLAVTADEWSAFVAGLKTGQFDLA